MLSPSQTEDSSHILGNEEVMVGVRGIEGIQNRVPALEGFNKPGGETEPSCKKTGNIHVDLVHAKGLTGVQAVLFGQYF